MELEFFVEPGSDEEWHQKWVDERVKWWERQGVDKNNLEIIDVDQEELSHYSKRLLISCINFLTVLRN